MPDIDFAQLRELASKATPRPWVWRSSTKFDCDNGLRVHVDAASDYDVQYIVAAANALPALLDEVERMRLELAAHLAVIHRLHAYAVADHEIVWRDIVAMLDEERAELKGSYHD